MPKINSRSKGNRCERDVCRILSKWWINDDECFNKLKMEEYPYRRCPGSGSFDHKRFPGDLITPKEFPFVVEIKHRESWSWDQFFRDSSKWDVNKYWEQVHKDAETSDKRPLLIFTKNRHPHYVRIYKNDFDTYNMAHKIILLDYGFCYFFKLEEWVKTTNPALNFIKKSKKT